MLDVCFNPTKSSFVVLSDRNVGDVTGLEIQGMTLPVEKSYKYLGITISSGSNYMDSQEDIWKDAAEKALQQLRAQSLWGFNRFEITRVQWKATAVPRLTYSNAVTVMSRNLLNKLATSQNFAGRWALGVPNYKIPNAFVQGELGWSSFEAREAQSKMRYFSRVGTMDDKRWPKAILDMMVHTGVKSRAYSRLETLMKHFDCIHIPIESVDGKPRLGKYNKEIVCQVRLVEDTIWRQDMKTKSSLLRYQRFKKTRGSVDVRYDNSRGSGLLAVARAGVLPTRCHRKKFVPELDTTCLYCGMEPETLEHILHECNDCYFTEEDSCLKLGFTEVKQAAPVKATKRLLEKWETFFGPQSLLASE